MCVDTEECQIPRGTAAHKPITYGGKEAADWLKAHLGFHHGSRPKSDQRRRDLEFDTVEDTIVGCRRHNQENYGRVLSYVRGR